MASSLLLRLAYRSGLMGAYHRWANRDTLTVVMFHRVLPPGDPRAAGADADYTVSASLFSEALGFFRRHYHVVDLAAVRAAHAEARPLPPRALLITFDDGWADNAHFALPALREAGLPAVIFVAADVIDRPAAFFQEALVDAWQSGRLAPEALGEIAAGAGVALAPASLSRTAAALRKLIAALEALTEAQREGLLAPHAAALAPPVRQMLTGAELRALRDGGVAVGSHGKTHRPLTSVADLDAELDGSRRLLAACTGEVPDTLSFPHGRFDAAVAAAARRHGFALLFTSIVGLNAVRGNRVPGLLARVGFDTALAAGPDGRLDAARVAAYYFRRPALTPVA